MEILQYGPLPQKDFMHPILFVNGGTGSGSRPAESCRVLAT